MIISRISIPPGSPCDCGYYDFFKKVMEINELHDFHVQLAKVLVEGRGDRGSTLIILGPAGSGKTHFVSSPLTLILKDKCFVLPSGDGSYLLSAILERNTRLFVLDEVTLPRCQLLFGNERAKGWFKAWLQFLTALCLDVPCPKNNNRIDTTWWEGSAPIIGTTTHKLRLDEGMDDGIDEDEIDGEQEQLDDRITYLRLKYKIKKCIRKGKREWADVVPAKCCATCFSRLMKEGEDEYRAQQKALRKEQKKAKKKRDEAAAAQEENGSTCMECD